MKDLQNNAPEPQETATVETEISDNGGNSGNTKRDISDFVPAESLSQADLSRALGLGRPTISKKIRNLEEIHKIAGNADRLYDGRKISQWGQERLLELHEIGLAEYRDKFAQQQIEPTRTNDDGGAGAGQLATISEANPEPAGKLGLMPDTSDLDNTAPISDAGTQRHSRYRDIAEANNAATSQRFANLAQSNRQLIEGAMEEGRALGQMLSAAQQQAMLSEYQRQQDAFQKRFGSLGDEIAEGE
jgi:hypothetical protein